MQVRVTVPLLTKGGVLPAGTEIDLPDAEAEDLLREAAPPVERIEAPEPTPEPKPAPKRRRTKKAP